MTTIPASLPNPFLRPYRADKPLTKRQKQWVAETMKRLDNVVNAKHKRKPARKPRK